MNENSSQKSNMGFSTELQKYSSIRFALK